jgi:diacylglycerol kinase
MRINPEAYSPITSTSRVASLKYALAGCLYMLRYQKNTHLIAIATLLVVIVGLWLQISAIKWSILTVTIIIVWMAEFINAAIEAIFNLVSPEWHPMAKVGKDVAAATVLLGVIASIIVGLLLLAPPFWEKVFG